MTWSSQRYRSEGAALGIDRLLIERAIEQIERVLVPHPELPHVLTLNHLAVRTDTIYETLREFVEDSLRHYSFFSIRKRSGGHRLISVPSASLMRVQRWIAAHILNDQPVHHCSFAFKPKSSIIKCAARHSGARWLIKMDVSGFFGSISEIQVYRAFRELNYQPLIAFELSRLTTHPSAPKSGRYKSARWVARLHSSPIADYRSTRIGHLPQGAPTSPMLSNIVMRKADEEIYQIAQAANLRYTRYSDDLTFSTTFEFTRDKARELIRDVSKVLRKMGLEPNTRKTVVVPPGGRKVVLGLLVDGDEPSLTRDFREMLRQHLYFLEERGPSNHATARGFDSIWGMYRHVRGLIDFAKMVDEEYAVHMLARLHNVEWPDNILS